MNTNNTKTNTERHRSLGLCLSLFLLLALSLGNATAAPTKAEKVTPRTSWAVLELFTSQSCGACFAATELLEELAGQPGILALNWGVDYWDHLGWKDTLAKPEFSKRQRHYNQQHGRPGIFTPQMIIGGQFDAVGSNRADIEAALSHPEAKAQGVSLTLTDASLQFTLPQSQWVSRGKVTLVHFKTNVDVAVTAGENEGRTLHYPHAVMDIRTVGEWDGSTRQFTIGRDQLCDEGNALLIQNEDGGAILYAALIINGQVL
jgi:hypothetical protein